MRLLYAMSGTKSYLFRIGSATFGCKSTIESRAALRIIVSYLFMEEFPSKVSSANSSSSRLISDAPYLLQYRNLSSSRNENSEDTSMNLFLSLSSNKSLNASNEEISEYSGKSNPLSTATAYPNAPARIDWEILQNICKKLTSEAKAFSNPDPDNPASRLFPFSLQYTFCRSSGLSPNDAARSTISL